MNRNTPRMSPEDELLLAQLYARYHSQIYFYAYSFLKDEYVAQDIVSDVFTLACEKFSEFKNHENQIGWLYKTARYKMSEVRRRLKKEVLGSQEDAAQEFESLLQAAPGNSSQYSLRELELAIHDALNADEYKRFQRYFIRGFSLPEMAELEGISCNNMSVRLSRLRRKLQELL